MNKYCDTQRCEELATKKLVCSKIKGNPAIAQYCEKHGETINRWLNSLTVKKK